MFDIYAASYCDTSRARFNQDFKDKTHCIVLRDADEVIVGFTTLKLYEKTWFGKPIRVMFSGDTIIDREHWGSQRLAFAWMRLAGEIWQDRPDVPLYWFLICKGHRTYRYLDAVALSYAPRAGTVTDPGIQALMDYLAIDCFGQAYDPKTGVLSFEVPQGRLTTELAQVPAPHLRLENVLYFLEKNPRYAAGDELVCLCELHPDNLRPMVLRLFASALKSPC
ncbi:hypothetical protein [Pseudomonas sp. St316]|uniref:hypothetical protein n=1 Tax=Pseudomonas sp. St316 TaxID=2678257 RepID=UPI001BB43F14|nr:hypothetical protein [Pseudomonas sp. St316]